jgi:hypothetical protein
MADVRLPKVLSVIVMALLFLFAFKPFASHW